jgi:hypothetical protein
LRWRLAAREARFLALAGRAIYGHLGSPYLALLRAAGCEWGDLEVLVRREGLEGALGRLVECGVYLTFDEFKGRQPVVRGSLRLAVSEADFDQPGLKPHVEAWSGGTRGPATSVKMGLSYFADLAVNTALALQAHGLSDYGQAVWLQGFTPGFIYARLAGPVRAWFYPLAPLPAPILRGSQVMSALSRLGSRALPTPVYLALQEPERLAVWLAQEAQAGRPICLTTYASSAVRVARAAEQRALSLEGVCFITLGEPFTAAKRGAVEASGARALVRYAFTEAGIIGYGCAAPSCSDDLHFLSDSYGLARRARTVGAGGLAVDAFLFSSLLGTAPKVLLNVESGDYGRLERRDCGCALGAAGLSQHLAEIRSFEKLSGEGMTFVQTDLLRVLEEVLPARFGGASTDYQVVEEEDQQGLLRLRLLVSPDLGPLNASLIAESFLAELERNSFSDSFGVKVWRTAGTVEVRRQQPVATGVGKILPFHLLGAPSPTGRSSV